MAVTGNDTLGYVVGAGTFGAVGTGTAVPVARRGDLNISLSYTVGGTATVTLERSFDYGTTWLPLTYIDGTALSWTAAISTSVSEPEGGTQYRFNCTAWTSGTVTWRISQ